MSDELDLLNSSLGPGSYTNESRPPLSSNAELILTRVLDRARTTQESTRKRSIRSSRSAAGKVSLRLTDTGAAGLQLLDRPTTEAPPNRRGGGTQFHLPPPSADAIKGLRNRLNLTQVEFAETYGVDLEALRNWEQARRNPDRSASTLLSLIEEDPAAIERMVQAVHRKKLEVA